MTNSDGCHTCLHQKRSAERCILLGCSAGNYSLWEPKERVEPGPPKGQPDARGYIWGCGHDCRDNTCTGCKVTGYASPPRTYAVSMPENPKAIPTSLPDDAKARTEYPMAEGLLDYFPNALAEVSKLSFLATQQHHPEAGMHWDRGKSTEHADKIIRHLVDRGKLDDKGLRHSAMVAWRALALLQEELEKDLQLPASRASRGKRFFDT